MRNLIAIVLGVLLLAAVAQAQGSGPTLRWSVPAAEAVNVSRWQVCLDGACSDVSPIAADGGFSYTFPSPLTAQAHTFSVKACNALACVASDDFAVSVPPKPLGLTLQ
jgi:hypothetical protein